jgi:hypothetical protein
VRPRTAHEREINDLKRRILDLAERDRIAIHQALQESLAATQPPTVADQQNERRAQASRVMDRVAEHLRLDDDGKRELTMGQFDAVDPDVRESWRAARVAGAFGKSWPAAKTVWLGHSLGVNLHQRQLRRQAARRDQLFQDHILGLRRWLDEEPETPELERYDAWAEQQNASREPGARPLVKASTIVRRRSWNEALRLARHEDIEEQEAKPDEEARRTEAEAPRTEAEAQEHTDEPLPSPKEHDRQTDPQLLSRRIFYARKARDLRRSELSIKASLADGALYRLETGIAAEPYFWTMARLAIALEVPLDHFITPDGRTGLPPARGGPRGRKKRENRG